MEPRYRGCRVIFARSFARIHETNLKKQGIVPLTFEDPSIYDQIEETDVISVRGMPPVPDQPIQCLLANQKGKEIPFTALHTFSKEQVQWFKAGSALNVVRQKVTKAKK
jgi:aconitate hydratase